MTAEVTPPVSGVSLSTTNDRQRKGLTNFIGALTISLGRAKIATYVLWDHNGEPMTLQQYETLVQDLVVHRSFAPQQVQSDEFSARRDQLVEDGRARPIERLASFLLFLVRDSARAGGDGQIIGEDLRCDCVAELLQFSFEGLGIHLLTLQRMGIVIPRYDGALAVIDLVKLEEVASAGSEASR